MRRLHLAALALLALIGCTQQFAAAERPEEEGSSTASQVAPAERLRGDGGDAGAPVRKRDAAPEPDASGTGDDCVDKGFAPEARFCGRSAGTEQILYRCENNAWVVVAQCLNSCAVGRAFGEDSCE